MLTPYRAWIDSIQYDPFGEAVIPLDTMVAHIILVGDYGGDQTGSYSFYIQRLNNPANQTPIAYRQTLSGEISIAPEMEVFAGKTGLPLCNGHGRQLELKEVVLYDEDATHKTPLDHCWVCKA